MRKAYLLSVALAVPFVASALELEFSAGAIQQKPSGYASYKGDRVYLKRDARVGDKTAPWVRLKFEPPIPLIPNIKLGYMPMKFEGSGTLTRDIRWGNYTFQANADYKFSLKADRVDVTSYYNLPFIRTLTKDIVDIEFGANVRVMNFEGRFEGVDKTTNQKVSESKSITVPVPMGHVGLEIRPIKHFSVLGSLNYIGYKENKYYDYTAGGRFYMGSLLPLKRLNPFVEVGYRHEKLKIDESDVKADINVKGGYAMLGLRF
ncbi:MAG: TIGR04219 family outer membrane beta-barrel protein [Aquificota bacterium]|nr:MAG: TIGR04219 family outer membrane beta-barrel protein [Aquificota bacterium]